MRSAILGALDEAGVTLWWDGQVLRYRAPLGVMTEVLYEGMREARAELIVAAEARGGVLLPANRASWPSSLRREFEAQAAKLAGEGRISPREVERRARARAVELWLRRQIGAPEDP